MSTVQRKEFQETKIMRTVSPVRNFRSSSQNLAEFDHNLDYLLEDLQNSVSRPNSSIGNYRESSKGNSLSRFTNVKASNPVTEYSSDDAYSYTSPDGNKKVSSYKKESYSYQTSGAPETRTQNNINQLDSLLDDLQQVKSSSQILEKESYNSSGAAPDLHTTSSKRSVQRELHYGDTPRSSSKTRTLEKEIQYSNEGTYGDLRPLRTRSPSPSSKTSTLTKQTTVKNVHSYPLEVLETTAPDIHPEVLAHLDPALHPPGNTKVTTTIKTYTYEIPGSGDYPSSLGEEQYVHNQSQSTPSKSFVYKKLDKSAENTIIDHYQPYQKPNAPGYKETVTTRTYQPGYSPDIPPSRNQTYIYNETTTTRNLDDRQSSLPRQKNYVVEENVRNVTRENYPPRQDTYIVKETNTTNVNNKSYPSNGYPPHDKTVVYRHETHTTNNQYGPGSKPRFDVESFDPKHPPYGHARPNEPVNIQYRYKSESKTTNNYKAGYPPGDDSEALLPKKFPVDSQPDGPPKRLDDLMAKIGNEPPNSPYNASFTAHEHELEQRKKIETLKRQQEEAEEQKKEPLQKSKNVSGPPVYYPPGHELFAKKEEEGAWRAEGAYQKASGNYKYEADSNSKSKSKSGAAVVPVCLPLCCGLPCAIL